MNQAQKKNGKWVEVEYKTDGIYANGVRIADTDGTLESNEFKRIEFTSL